MMKRMGSDSLKKLEMIALVKVYVKCRNDLGFVWSKVASIPPKDQITVYLSQGSRKTSQHQGTKA